MRPLVARPSHAGQGRRSKTSYNRPSDSASQTAFRGFGGPQGMLFCEEILDRVARHLGLPPETVRERNFYRGTGEQRLCDIY